MAEDSKAEGSDGRSAIGREYRVAEGQEGVGAGKPSSPQWGVVWEGGCAPSAENVWNFSSEMVHFASSMLTSWTDLTDS